MTPRAPALPVPSPRTRGRLPAFAFGCGAQHIATVDADGVALAAIQGLNQKVEEQRAALKQKRVEIAELEKRNSALEQRVEKLETVLASVLAGSKHN